MRAMGQPSDYFYEAAILMPVTLLHHYHAYNDECRKEEEGRGWREGGGSGNDKQVISAYFFPQNTYQ